MRLKKVSDDDLMEVLGLMYRIHFNKLDPDFATCKDCLDYKIGLCQGGCVDVIDCMLDKSKEVVVFSNN